MTQILNESLTYLDMETLVLPLVGIDKYKSTMGKDSDIITLSFTVKNGDAAEDLVNWFERGYDYVLDADRSPGEVAPSKYIVFVEIERNRLAPRHIIELVSDLETLTGIPIKKWHAKIDHTKGEVTDEFLKEHLSLKPSEYKEEHDIELNEWRSIAGIETVTKNTQDESILAMQRQAGII